MKFKCIVIEDEPPAMSLIASFIQRTPFLQLDGQYFNAIEALNFIQNNPVEILFLDIQMPDFNGIELARILSTNSKIPKPAVVFTTAFDQFAIEGYQLDVVDYLLKPFEYEDFLKAAKKAVRFARYFSINKEQTLPETEALFLKVEYKTVKIPYKDIVVIEGLKDYAKFSLLNPERTLVSLVTLKSLEEKLPPEKFMRIHKSSIVCIDKITSISRSSVSIGEQMFTVSDPYKENLNRLMDSWRQL